MNDWQVPGVGGIKTSPTFSLRYNLFWVFLLIITDLGLVFLRPLSFDLPTLKPSQILIVFAGIYVGCLSNVFIHNATHKCFRPRWTNLLIGEIMGLFHLYGFWGYRVAHLIHHQYPDDPERDPHPPLETPFWPYVYNHNKNIQRILSDYYAFLWGKSDRIRRIRMLTKYVYILTIVLRLLFWILLLGIPGMVFFYLPAFVFYQAFIYHFDYRTHRPKGKGVYEIVNVNHNLYYKTANLLLFGMYFHYNHHLKPYLFNPKRMK